MENCITVATAGRIATYIVGSVVLMHTPTDRKTTGTVAQARTHCTAPPRRRMEGQSDRVRRFCGGHPGFSSPFALH